MTLKCVVVVKSASIHISTSPFSYTGRVRCHKPRDAEVGEMVGVTI
jgi:hypothetical protein